MTHPIPTLSTRAPAPARAPRLAGDVPIAPFGFVVVRTPLLPWHLFASIGDGGERAWRRDDGKISASRLARHRDAARARLRALLEDPAAREAIFVASPSLSARLDTWMAAPEATLDSEPLRKIEAAALRYLARMAGRATPFGLFAGCTLGVTSDATRIALAPRNAYTPGRRRAPRSPA
jgi:lantibiotic biosynthesis protein